jgi:hypothetical protein
VTDAPLRDRDATGPQPATLALRTTVVLLAAAEAMRISIVTGENEQQSFVASSETVRCSLDGLASKTSQPSSRIAATEPADAAAIEVGRTKDREAFIKPYAASVASRPAGAGNR